MGSLTHWHPMQHFIQSGATLRLQPETTVAWWLAGSDLNAIDFLLFPFLIINTSLWLLPWRVSPGSPPRARYYYWVKCGYYEHLGSNWHWVIKADAGVTLVTVWRMMSRHKHRYLPPSPSQSRRIVLTISGIRNELFVSVMRWLILRQCYHFLLREQLVHHEISVVMWVCWLCFCVSVYPHRKYYLENTDVLLIFLLRTRYRRYHLVFPGPGPLPGLLWLARPWGWLSGRCVSVVLADWLRTIEKCGEWRLVGSPPPDRQLSTLWLLPSSADLIVSSVCQLPEWLEIVVE